jgi:hypothetical protein
LKSLTEETSTITEIPVTLPIWIINEEDRLVIQKELLDLKKEVEQVEKITSISIKKSFPENLYFIPASRHIIEKIREPIDFSHSKIIEREDKKDTIEWLSNKEDVDRRVEDLKKSHWKFKVKKIPVSYFLKKKAKPIKI